MIATDRPIYVDANVFIYALESDGEEGMPARRWFTQMDLGQIRGVTSELTSVEVLPYPISRDDVVLVDGYRRVLTSRPSLRIAPVTSDVLRLATELRAKLGSETPDAIHLATALIEGCGGFLTNDDRLKPPPGLARYPLAGVIALYR